MTILFLSENPHTQIGGIENHITHIGKVLEERGGSVAYLSAKELASRTVMNKQVVPMKVIEKNIVSIAPDVIHVHGFSSFFVYQCLSVIKKILPNATLVYTPHYHPFEYHNHSLLAAAFFHLLLKRSFRNIDILIVLTDNEKDFFAQYTDVEKIHIVPNGIDVERHRMAKEKPSEDTLLFVGRNDHNKRLDFIEAQREYFKRKDMRCHIVTNEKKVSDETFTYYLDLAAPQLGRLYEQCTLLAVPSKYEAFSIVALEAISYGMPVLVSDHVQIKSYFEENDTFNHVFDYDDKEDFQRKLDAMLAIDPEEYKVLSQKNIQFSKRFDWGKVVDRLSPLYLKKKVQA